MNALAHGPAPAPCAPCLPPATVYRTWIHLADNEWGSDLMLKVARQYADDYRNIRPLVVTVHEHAGWWLSWAFETRHGNHVCVGTANDMAVFGPESQALRERYKEAKTEYLEHIRRP